MKNLLLAVITCCVLAVATNGQQGNLVCKDVVTGQTIPCPTFDRVQPTPRPMPGCTLGIEQSPTVRGLKLGMPEADAARLLDSRFLESYEDRIYLQELNVKPRSGDFGGVEYLTLKSFDGKVSSIRIKYDVNWNDIDEFVENFTPKLGVPAYAWKIESFEATMRCRDFDLRLRTGFNDLLLNDRTVDEQIAKLKAEYENDKKKAIKP